MLDSFTRNWNFQVGQVGQVHGTVSIFLVRLLTVIPHYEEILLGLKEILQTSTAKMMLTTWCPIQKALLSMRDVQKYEGKSCVVVMGEESEHNWAGV